MTLLDRAGQLPLRLHFIDHFGTCRRSNNPVDRISFLAPVTPQLESLELVPSTDGLSRARTSALSIFLAACMARNLTELALRIIYGGQISTPIFIKPRNHAIETATMTDGMRAHIDIPEERLEAMLRGLTVLKLSQVYPQWTSSAYCGLVELRLLAGALFNAKIPESQLMGILRSSPRLRILQFGLTIVDTVPLDTAIIDPIVLRDLEVLSLDWTQGFRAEIFLRWLAPAPKLFQFSLCRSRYYANDIYSVHPITVAFLAKSNITMIYTNLLAQEIVDLVSHCLHAKILACDNLLDYDEETMPFQLNTLYLIECELETDSLRRLIRSSSARRLIIYRSDFLYNCRLLSPDQIPAMLSDICSDVFVLPKDDPSLIAEWEVSWP